jgi:pimeloyl-ACP methyl ester carboxylesterase
MREEACLSHLAPNIEYAESGEGPAVLFLPGSFGNGAGWRSVIGKIGGGYRFVTTSLLGYGATAERRPLGNATMAQQIEVLDAIFERINAPVHVVAHSYGGLSALAHTLDGRHKPASLVLIEANPLAILRTAGDEAAYCAFSEMTSVYFQAFEAGHSDAARHVIDFYGGRGAFDAMPDKVRDYIVATTPSNIRDWTSGTPFARPLARYGEISMPTHVIRGGNTHPAMARIAELLVSNIPNALLTTLDGGSHFLPATHAAAVAALIASHVQGAANIRG